MQENYPLNNQNNDNPYRPDDSSANYSVNPSYGQSEYQYPPEHSSQHFVQNADEGAGLGIASIVLSFFISIVGLVLGLVGMSKYKNNKGSSGYRLSKIGVIISSVFTVLSVVSFGLLIMFAGAVWEEGATLINECGADPYSVACIGEDYDIDNNGVLSDEELNAAGFERTSNQWEQEIEDLAKENGITLED